MSGGRLFLSFFGIGFVPVAPGTFGSLAGLIVILLIERYVSISLEVLIGGIVLAVIALSAIAIPLIKAEKRGQDVDQSWIVIDEVVGIWISILPFLFLTELEWLHIGIAFALFRLFDITKPLGIDRIDARKTPASVMLDDIVAGVYAMIGGVVLIAILDRFVI